MHATLAFTVALGLWPLGRAWRWPLVVLGVAVAFARVFAGLHWPTDVVAGALLGGFAGWALPRVARPLDPYLNRLLDALGPLGRDARRAGGWTDPGTDRA